MPRGLLFLQGINYYVHRHSLFRPSHRGISHVQPQPSTVSRKRYAPPARSGAAP